MSTLKKLIDSALSEDIGSGDITTDNLIAPDQTGSGEIIAKEPMVLAGLDVARQVFKTLDPDLTVDTRCADGDELPAGSRIMTLAGHLGPLLHGERTSLNFLQRLSGIATHVRPYVAAVSNYPVRLVDTRKTTPGWRVLEKYAVRVGGAANHRMGLYDGVLIKDNHIAACGSITTAVTRVRAATSHLVKLEVEVSSQKEVAEALRAGADVIMLDNMDLDEIRAAVTKINQRAIVEISGNVSLEKLPSLAQTGVDIISVGALTHQARSVDISMRITPHEPQAV
ncbi:MAG: carboxylating nicotinate-nucleotide diphosphorylase [Desulfobacterales bacterium]|nr:carboxylating nicotinate-nucleotide diphosphorylase [Desulfobacterales bacterium]